MPPPIRDANGRRVVRIPDGLTELLQEFTITVLRDQPDDLVHFAAEYFERRRAEERGVASLEGDVSSNVSNVSSNVSFLKL